MDAPTNPRAGPPFVLDVLAILRVVLIGYVSLPSLAFAFIVDLATNSAVSTHWCLLPPAYCWLHFATDVLATLLFSFGTHLSN